MKESQNRSISEGLSYPENACAPNLFWEKSSDCASDLAVMDWKERTKKEKNIAIDDDE